MPDTSVTLPDSRRDRLIGGHSRMAGPFPHWDFDVLAPAGGLRSTAEDMLSFLDANLRPRDDALGLALRRAQEVHFEGERGMKVGLAWQIRDIGPRARGSTGTTAGPAASVSLSRPRGEPQGRDRPALQQPGTRWCATPRSTGSASTSCGSPPESPRAAPDPQLGPVKP
jgi:CubicO group peptidase (beta-lactamase class C family)